MSRLPRLRRPELPPLPADRLGRAGAAATATLPRRSALTAVAVIGAWVLAAALLPHGAPVGIVLEGTILGAINALVTLSIVLVYRANRAINFAAASFGSVAIVAIEVHIQLGLDYALSMVTGVLLAAGLGALLEMTVIRRFANAPRLILAVATIGLAQLLDAVSVIIPVEWSGTKSGTFAVPWSAHFFIAPVLFNANYLVALIVVPAVLVGLTWFMRYSAYGVAIRASADNGERARLLGLPVNRLSTIVWTITGILSALAVLLRVPILGFLSFNSVSQSGPDLLLQTLTAAMLAGLASLPVALFASVGLGIASELAAWSTHDATAIDAALLVIILVALLLQRNRLSRAMDSGIATWQAIRPVRPVPPELTGLREVRIGTHATRLGLLAFALTLPLWLSDAHQQLAGLILIYGMVAASLVVLTGWAGHISLGHVAFMGFGAAVTATLVTHHGWDVIAAILVGGVVTAAIAVVLGLPALRIPGEHLAIVTLAFAVTAANYFLVPRYFPVISTDLMNRPNLFGRIATGTDKQMYYVALVALALTLAAVRSLRASSAGRTILAVKENRLAAQSFALNATRLNLVAFAISGAIAGVAGGLYAIQQEGFNPASFSAEDGLTFFSMVVIGGLGSIPGAVLGAIYVYGAQYLLPGAWSGLATGAGLLLLLMFFPGGLGEAVFRLRDGLLRRIARRHDLVVPSLLADVRVEDDAPHAEHPDDITVAMQHAAAAPPDLELAGRQG